MAMNDKEWKRFVKWWKSKWINSPDRQSVEQYLKWKEEQELLRKVKRIDTVVKKINRG